MPVYIGNENYYSYQLLPLESNSSATLASHEGMVK